MKQLIVLVASIVLGVGIGGIVLGFRDSATELGEAASSGLSGVVSVMAAASEEATDGLGE